MITFNHSWYSLVIFLKHSLLDKYSKVRGLIRYIITDISSLGLLLILSATPNGTAAFSALDHFWKKSLVHSGRRVKELADHVARKLRTTAARRPFCFMWCKGAIKDMSCGCLHMCTHRGRSVAIGITLQTHLNKPVGSNMHTANINILQWNAIESLTH
jgi:hypothetical protein